MKLSRFKYTKIWEYPSKNTSREEARAILGFDPGPNTKSKSTLIGYITKVDKKNGIITISNKRVK